MTDDKKVIVTSDSPVYPSEHVSVTAISREMDVSIPSTFDEMMKAGLISVYENNRLNYIPIPEENAYYDIENDSTEDMSDKMILNEEDNIFAAIKRLKEYPFLLLDKEKNITYHVVSGEKFIDMREDLMAMEETGDHIDSEDTLGQYTYDEMWEKYPELAEETIGDRGKYEFITLSGVNRRQVKDSIYPYIADLAEQLGELIKDERSSVGDC